jgi:hypothetical protein
MVDFPDAERPVIQMTTGLCFMLGCPARRRLNAKACRFWFEVSGK